MSNRSIEKLVRAQRQSEGVGATVHRTIGRPDLSVVDPFLLLDEFELKPGTGAGFPEHPHRGFETVTYMFSGRIGHKDTSGNAGVIGPGGVQWMTAGRGLVHSEMPVEDGSVVHGMQLWVNLPAKDKMKTPRYQDITATDIPAIAGDGYSARLIAGDLAGKTGPVRDIAVRPLYADITLTGGTAILPVQPGHTVFLYGITGAAEIEGQTLGPRMLAILGDGDTLRVTGEKDTRFILAAGAPTREPVARYGPFVMNTREEILATIDDWNAGRFLNPAA